MSQGTSTPPPPPGPTTGVPHQKASARGKGASASASARGVDPAVLKKFSRRTRTGLPNWAVGACLVGFVGGAYFYTMQAVRAPNPGGAKEELEQAILQEMKEQEETKK